MFKGILFLISLAISAFAATVESQPWRKVVQPVKGFADHDVHALGATGDLLYIASFLPKKKHSAFLIMNVKTGVVRDVSSKIKLNPQDSVTAILVDSSKAEVWIATNNNLSSATCFDAELNFKKCDKKFLNDYVGNFSRVKGEGGNSIETASYDENGGVTGEFKGNVYLISKENKKDLVYKTSFAYNWPIASVLNPSLALASTRGDGLIAVDRKSGKAQRFPDKDSLDIILALAISGKKVFLGGKGLFQSSLAALAPK